MTTQSRTRSCIISAFIGGQPLTNYRNLSTDGKELISYSTTIAYRDNEGSIVVREVKRSRTTTRQLNELKSQLDKAGLKYKTSIPIGGAWYLGYVTWSTPV